ncbi:MAG: hypothetical protein WC505_06585 [Patescibacteria group bacterium]
MIGIANIFLPLFIQILLLYGLSRAVDRIVLQRLGRRWYLLTMWPGVVCHELSHLIACLATFTRVRRVRLFYPSGDSLGFVEHDRTGNPLKKVVISIAPLFGVTAAMLLLAWALLPDLYHSSLSTVQAAVVDFSSFASFFRFTVQYFSQFWDTVSSLVQAFNWDSWQTYVFIYLMLSLSSHAAPSREDLSHTFSGLLGIAALFTLFFIVDQWLQVPMTWTVISWMTTPLFLAAQFLMYGILFAAISLCVLVLLSLVARPLIKRIE